MRLLLLIAVAALAGPAIAKEKAAFIKGQYATEKDCQKLRAIEAGGPRNVETAPELLDTTGFNGWEGACEFTRVFEHDAGKSWIGLMACFEGPNFSPQTYIFIKSEADDSFEVSAANKDEPEIYKRCDAGKGK